MTDRQPQRSDNDAPKTPPSAKEKASNTEIASSGDNRRLGDQDGNKNAGDAHSPGADNPE